MICSDTIQAGFYFMLGKLLFDLSIFLAAFAAIASFWAWVIYRSRK